MSLEDQYDAWVRSVTGTGRHSATKQDRDAAQNSLNAMQAQLDALAESQKRQKSAADALNAVQRAGAATADSVRRMSSELTQSLRQDGLLGGKTAQPAPAAEPVKAGPENFNGLADRVRQQVLGQDAFVGQVVKAFRRPFVMGTADTAHARGSMLLCGPTGTGRHYALTCIVDEMAGRGLLHSALIETMDLALYPGPAQEKLFLQDLYAALQSDAEVLAFDHYESCASNYLNMLATLAIDGTLPLTSRYVLQRGILVDVGTALAPGAIGELQAAGKYFVFFSNRDETALADKFGARFVDALEGGHLPHPGVHPRKPGRHCRAGAEPPGPAGQGAVRPCACHGQRCAGPGCRAVRQNQRHDRHARLCRQHLPRLCRVRSGCGRHSYRRNARQIDGGRQPPDGRHWQR